MGFEKLKLDESFMLRRGCVLEKGCVSSKVVWEVDRAWNKNFGMKHATRDQRFLKNYK